MAVVHFGAVMKNSGGEVVSYGTLCGLEWDCKNRDPDATTCKVCLRSRGWGFAVSTVQSPDFKDTQ